jgi:hypothetical protein
MTDILAGRIYTYANLHMHIHVYTHIYVHIYIHKYTWSGQAFGEYKAKIFIINKSLDKCDFRLPPRNR